MNWPAALSGAALRVTRTAVGRRVRQRVLQVALLVGGLFVLGVVFGGQAQAAEGGSVPAKPVNLGKPGIPVVTSVVKSVPVLVPVSAPVSDTVVRVVQPVSDLVTKTVTEVLTEAPSLPTLPTPPSVPAVPSQLVPSVPVPPAHTAPVPAPVRSVPQSSGGGHRSDARPAEVTVGVGATYGPRFVADTADAFGAVGHAVVRHDASAASAPTHRAPTGDPGGAQRNQAGVDNGGSRHCDACAVTLGFRVPVRIVPGAATRADVGETRDRYRDVPVFPA
ncbi:hypothetical protein [Streptomyces sp. NPDC051665]|uniref:hypothetical protein n=1 Tax=Streptomyces sp. NPDC051665 TaxID=3154647 RepID=UPI003447F2D3